MNRVRTYPEAWIKKVVKADTIEVDVDLGFCQWVHELRVRLFGIQGHRIHGAEKEAGLAAIKFIRDRVGNQPVMLRSFGRLGRHSHWLVTVLYGEDKRDLNREMIQEGIAHKYIGHRSVRKNKQGDNKNGKKSGKGITAWVRNQNEGTRKTVTDNSKEGSA